MSPHHAFDYYVRSVTTALLALGLVGAAVYEFVAGKMVSTVLSGWAGLVLGVYFGQHVTLNGRRLGRVETEAANGTAKPHGDELP